jgi:hypothetical protein
MAQITQQNPTTSPKLHKILYVVVLILIIAAAAGAFYLSANHSKKNATSKSPDAYKYAKLDSYHWQCGDHCGLTFNKPVEFKAHEGIGFVILEHDQNNQPALSINKIIVGNIIKPAEVNDKNLPPKSQSDTAFINIVQPFQNYIQQKITPSYKVTFGSISQDNGYRSPGSSWKLHYTGQFQPPPNMKLPDNVSQQKPAPIKPPASAQTPKPQAKPQKVSSAPDLNGEARMVITDKYIYYILVNTSPANWQTDQAIWQQVFSSIKADQ